MKKFLLLMLFPCLGFGQIKETFFDFNTFEDQIREVYPNERNQLLSEDGIPVAELGSEMFMFDNWSINFQGHAQENPFSRINSYTKRITSEERGTVLGVRIQFPDWPNNNTAFIKPHFPLLPFKRTGEYANINNGVVTNVGLIKSFSMWVSGRNFPFNFGVRVRDIKAQVSEFYLGSLLYVGWRKLTYINSMFTKSIVHNILPPKRIYPSDIPLLSFDTFVLYRQGNHDGGDFVGYFGGSEIEYTQYLTDIPTDVDDEMMWGIIRAEQERLASALNGQLYQDILQYEYARKRLPEEADGENTAEGAAAAEENNEEQ